MRVSAHNARRLQGNHDTRIKTLHRMAPWFVTLAATRTWNLVGQAQLQMTLFALRRFSANS
jgi:hypothetical protein